VRQRGLIQGLDGPVPPGQHVRCIHDTEPMRSERYRLAAAAVGAGDVGRPRTPVGPVA
jgi:hypothetical protein